MNMMM